MFSIADDNEFRFARFYIVCEAVPLGAPESPLIVCGLSDTPRELSKRGKTQNSMSDAAWLEIPDFAIRMSLPAVFWNFVFSDISIIKHRPFRFQKSGSYFWERVHAG